MYLNNYAGVTRLRRLAFIASASPAHKRDALALAAAEVKRTSNTALYNELIALSGDDGGLTRDAAWVETVDRKAQQRLDKLESDLNTHKTSLVKESIRMGHTDLGDFHYERGDFNAALKCYVRTRDYCTTSKHIITMCLNIIRVSIHMGLSLPPVPARPVPPPEPASAARSASPRRRDRTTAVESERLAAAPLLTLGPR